MQKCTTIHKKPKKTKHFKGTTSRAWIDAAVALGSPKMIGFFGFFGYSCAFLKDLMFYVFGGIGFLGTVAQFRVGHTSERSREPLPDYVDPPGLSPGPPGLFCTLLRCLLDPPAFESSKTNLQVDYTGQIHGAGGLKSPQLTPWQVRSISKRTSTKRAHLWAQQTQVSASQGARC